MPGFLSLPPRSSKPKTAGFTHVLDKGMHLDDLIGFIDCSGHLIDFWKFGWGTGYIDPLIKKKTEALSGNGIRACLGGTLLEVAWSQGKEDDYLAWAGEIGMPCVEVSNGALDLPVAEKRRLIAKAAENFLVLAEVGSKDPSVPVSPAQWAEQATGDIAAGASWVLGEGRESGSVGLYTPEGGVREEVVECMVAAAGAGALIFEAPRRSQQGWFVRRFGPDVNLGNVVPAEVLGLETMRLGLRADTIGCFGG